MEAVGGESGTFAVVLAAALVLLLVGGVLPRGLRRLRRRARRRLGRSFYPPPSAPQYDEFHRLVEEGTAKADERRKYRPVASRRRTSRSGGKREK